ncbi:MAG: thioredoxin family protein [Elusimicrobia bacterium]|nr:thioredoxin family protein [Elusimicrobiota bacterium]MDA8242609.1 thioredoxin family protein [Elusimicrobiota bacterium]
MGFMDQQTADEVRKRLADLPGAVKIVFFKENLMCQTCGPAEEFYREVSGLSDKVVFEAFNRVTDAEKAASYGVTLTPAAVVEGPAGARVRFYGIPAGYEFVSLLEALKNSAAGSQDLQPETVAALGAVAKPVNIKVFVTPTCPYCPSAVVMAHKFALASASVTAEMIEASEFPQLADKYGVSGVPQIVVNDRISLVGAQPEPAMLKAVLEAAA